VTEPTRERIAERVRRLLALAKSSNEHEATAAAQKAQELLHRHDLSMAEVSMAEPPEVTKEGHKLANGAGWRIALLGQVTRAYGCKMTYRPSSGGYCTVVGRKHVIEVVLHVNEYLARTIERLADDAARGMSFWTAGDARTWKNSFRLGASYRVGQRLKEQRELLKQESAQSTALVVVNDAAVQRFYDNLYPPGTLSSGRSFQSNSRDGYRAGSAAGNSIALNDAVRGRSGGSSRQLSGGSR